MSKKTILILALFCLLITQSCTRSPKPNVYVENEKSELLDILMRKTDFEISSTWSFYSIRQHVETPTEQNHWLIEVASAGLVGDYDNKHYVHVLHRLEKYNKQVDWINSTTLDTDENEELINISFPVLGDNSQSNCYLATYIHCKIVVQYDYILSYVSLHGPRTLSNDDILEMLVPVLMEIDERMNQ